MTPFPSGDLLDNLPLDQQALYFRQLLQTTPCAVIAYSSVRDQNGEITDFETVFFNQAYQDLTTVSAEDNHRLSLRTRFPDETFPGLFRKYKELVDSGIDTREERYYHHLDRWFDVSCSKFKDGFLLVSYDITSRKIAQIQAQQQADLLDGVLKNSLHSLSAFDAIRDESGAIVDFRITLTNPATLALFPESRWPGMTEEKMKSLTHLQLMPHTRENGIFQQMIEVVESGTSTRFSKDYPEYGMSLEYSANKFGDGLIIGIIDITALRRYQFQLEATNAALRQSNESLQQFAYVASHDLQEPLRKIQAFGDILANRYGPELNADGQDVIRRMQSAAERMTVLIQDLLAYSRVTLIQRTLAPVDLNTLVQEVLTDLDFMIREKNARVDVAALPTLPGDRMQFRQLFQNLISNALKFVRPGVLPVVTLTTEERVSFRQEPRLPKSGQLFYKISITDNGIGIDEQYLERIFQLFQRLHGRQEYSGTGIGLAICRKVVENHHGFLWVTSQKGEGSTFCVCLPASGS
ncbi:sensor histidine kinase [Tellurirhabdus rosea]|uniref:sensor histidine kinase n=1 Tax=Tellurirhabdus rosea TaxID=2674997 RepID=UPI00224F58F8|nr:ATP-binding protein [Tellurirhabdus rosea]